MSVIPRAAKHAETAVRNKTVLTRIRGGMLTPIEIPTGTDDPKKRAAAVANSIALKLQQEKMEENAAYERYKRQNLFTVRTGATISEPCLVRFRSKEDHAEIMKKMSSRRVVARNYAHATAMSQLLNATPTEMLPVSKSKLRKIVRYGDVHDSQSVTRELDRIHKEFSEKFKIEKEVDIFSEIFNEDEDVLLDFTKNKRAGRPHRYDPDRDDIEFGAFIEVDPQTGHVVVGARDEPLVKVTKGSDISDENDFNTRNN